MLLVCDSLGAYKLFYDIEVLLHPLNGRQFCLMMIIKCILGVQRL